mmetsp:Transcript_29573/g.67414  ORF Transcript_29573/g.67414 Transcript_29573/m.67414 type:complete len:262 (+) Transcript_29573:80-865(+)
MGLATRGGPADFGSATCYSRRFRRFWLCDALLAAVPPFLALRRCIHRQHRSAHSQKACRHRHCGLVFIDPTLHAVHPLWASPQPIQLLHHRSLHRGRVFRSLIRIFLHPLEKLPQHGLCAGALRQRQPTRQPKIRNERGCLRPQLHTLLGLGVLLTQLLIHPQTGGNGLQIGAGVLVPGVVPVLRRRPQSEAAAGSNHCGSDGFLGHKVLGGFKLSDQAWSSRVICRPQGLLEFHYLRQAFELGTHPLLGSGAAGLIEVFK